MGDDRTESVVKQATLTWLESTGWQVLDDAEIAPANLRLCATTRACGTGPAAVRHIFAHFFTLICI